MAVYDVFLVKADGTLIPLRYGTPVPPNGGPPITPPTAGYGFSYGTSYGV